MGLGLIPDTIFNLLDKHAQKKGAKQIIGQFNDYQTGATNALNGARDASIGYLSPYIEGGQQQFGAAQNMLAPGFKYTPSDPSYGFRFDEGMNALTRQQAASHDLGSGGAQKAAIRYGQGFASTEFANDFNRRNQLAELGLQAANTGAQVQAGYGREVSDVLLNAAKGRSAGYGMKADANSDFWGNEKGSIEDAVSNVAHLFGF
jgi:hypothetical protein